MVTVKCGHCGVVLKVPDERAGKKGTCPKCGQSVLAPGRSRPPTESRTPSATAESTSLLSLADGDGFQDDRSSEPGQRSDFFGALGQYEDEDSEEPVTARPVRTQRLSSATVGILGRIPKRVYLMAIGVLLLGAVTLGVWLALRDTWEADHHDQIIAMRNTVREHRYAYRYPAAMAAYDELRALVGDRKIEDPDLARAIHSAGKEAEESRSVYDDSRAKQYYATNKDAIVAAIAKGHLACQEGQFVQAVSELESAVALARKAPVPMAKMTLLLQQAEKELTAAKQAELRTFLAKLDQMTAQAEAVLDRYKFAEATRAYTEIIELARANTRVEPQAMKQAVASAEEGLKKVAQAIKAYDAMVLVPIRCSVTASLPSLGEKDRISPKNSSDCFLLITVQAPVALFTPSPEVYEMLRAQHEAGRKRDGTPGDRPYPPRGNVKDYCADRFRIFNADGTVFNAFRIANLDRPSNRLTYAYRSTHISFSEKKAPARTTASKPKRLSIACVIDKTLCLPPYRIQIDNRPPVPVPTKTDSGRRR